MRILWVKVGGLWPPHMGGRLRSFHLISELSRRHRVTVLTTHAPGDDPEGLAAALPAGEEVLSVPYAIPKRGTTRFALALLRSWLSPYPVDILKCRVPALRAQVERVLATGVDLCVADFLVAAANIPRGTSTPVVLFEHNVEHVIWKRLHDVERAPWRRALLDVEWRKMRRYEAAACSGAELTAAVSDADRALLGELAPGARIRAVPTGVDTAYFRPNGAAADPAHLVFTGAMDWFPNEHGILHFIREVLPAVRRGIPRASLTVVGRNPSERLRTAAATAGVQVTGTVADVRPHMARAAAYVVPLRVGGGTRLKIFEALAMGLPVVSTSIGAEGLPVVSGRHLLLADSPSDFAGAVVAILRDPSTRRRLGAAGRALVEKRYSWPQVTRAFEDTLEEARGDHAG